MRVKKLKHSISIKFGKFHKNPKESKFKIELVRLIKNNLLKANWTTMHHVYIYPNGCEYFDDVYNEIIELSKADLNQSFDF